ncbi:outer membrane family protein [Janthinobacterium agaricidamnosum NBRC 102515 = DSM 9628]|uniref:Outer membrane family protein n=1 Tax=Janthinobacterium agaricidamnosum NBRC 102515 = DSM 9628 TaxID=1349767 RepID=W0V7V1_9BURK|nr:outer membrane family protein [Janthinobacterium agaricidamnosum NBRC 102515 = DSM 9628]
MLTAQAQAQESRIAWLSIDRIYNESKQAKLASEKLAEEFKVREKSMQDLNARLKAASESLEKDMPTLSEADRVKRQREYFELDKEFKRRDREFREDLAQRTNEEREVVSNKAIKIIKEMAAVDGFDIVLYDAVWANPRIDITDKVLKALDK